MWVETSVHARWESGPDNRKGMTAQSWLITHILMYMISSGGLAWLGNRAEACNKIYARL